MSTIIKYQNKYNEFVNLYGLKDGRKKYFNFLRGCSLESCVLKYGEEEGTKKRNEFLEKQKTSGCSLNRMIERYGEEEGTKKYNDWKSSIRNDKNSLIQRYGEEEGLIRFEQFQNKCSIASKKCDHSKKANPRKINYWMKKFNLSEEESKLKVSEFQNKSSLDKFIKRYGEEEGLMNYLETNKKKTFSLENCIRLFGQIEGEQRYILFKTNSKYVKSKEGYIERYGEEEGLIKHKEHQNNRCNYLPKNYSKIALEFCESIFSKINNLFDKIYFGENEYMFFIHSDKIKVASPDFYVKDINLVIEFFGDYWHKNPKKYSFEEDINQLIWERDLFRINSIIDKFKSDVIIIWENDYVSNKDKTIEFIVSEILKRYEKNANS